ARIGVLKAEAEQLPPLPRHERCFADRVRDGIRVGTGEAAGAEEHPTEVARDHGDGVDEAGASERVEHGCPRRAGWFTVVARPAHLAGGIRWADDERGAVVSRAPVLAPGAVDHRTRGILRRDALDAADETGAFHLCLHGDPCAGAAAERHISHVTILPRELAPALSRPSRGCRDTDAPHNSSARGRRTGWCLPSLGI